MKRGLIVIVLILISLSFVSASWYGDLWNKIAGRAIEQAIDGQKLIFPTSAEVWRGTACNSNNILKKDFILAGLAYNGTEGYSTIDNINVTACIKANFEQQNNIEGIEIKYQSISTICEDSCKDNCGTGGDGYVFVIQNDSDTWRKVCYLDRSSLVVKTCNVSLDNVKSVLICRDASGASRDNLAIDYVALIQKPTISCYNDSDCGQPYSYTYCVGSQTCSITENYICTDPGTIYSTCLTASGGGCGNCTYGCKDGACVNETTEQVTCKFANSDSQQKCYTNDNKFSCDGIGTCATNVSGVNGTKQTWKSSCSGEYPIYTLIDGIDEYIEFDCVNVTCVDSDGGIDYYVKGNVKGIFGEGWSETGEEGNVEDKCHNDTKTLEEQWCYKDKIGIPYLYMCPGKCKDGACINETLECKEDKDCIEIVCPGGRLAHEKCVEGKCIASTCPGPAEQTCNGLYEKIRYPSNFEDSGFKYYLSWNSTYEYKEWINGKEYNATNYYASWYTYSEDYKKGYDIGYNLLVFDDKEVDLEEWLKQRTSYMICQQVSYWSADNKENKVYACTWDVLRNEQNIDNYNYKSIEILWAHENVAVQVYTYAGRQLTNEEVTKIAQKTLIQFLNDIRDNNFKYVEWEKFSVEWPLSREIEKSLAECPSEIQPIINPETNETCYACWNCKIEPVVCPEYGYQKKTCIDYCCEQKDKEEQVYCNPGICSGCYVPRWLESRENICIPYGFRFEHKTGERFDIVERSGEERLMEGEKYDYNLKVLSAEKAEFILFAKEKNYTYELEKGKEVKIEIPEWENQISEITLVVNDIIYSEEGENYVDVTIKYKYKQQVIDTINAYCDIDGVVKMQRDKKPDGSWVTCQNNYECRSNFCSSGECIEITSMLSKAKGYKAIFIKIICKLANMFDIEGYDQCLINYLK